MDLESFSTQSAWASHARAAQSEEDRRRAYERRLCNGTEFSVDGFCHVCAQRSTFDVDYRFAYAVDGILTPNWRESLVCRGCGLNNRMRAALHAFADLGSVPSTATILAAEETTALFRHLRSRYPNIIGFEYSSGEALSEALERPSRIDDLTSLTFNDGTFDAVLTFDVFEHIPNVQAAFAECRRALKPGGLLFFSVPFLFDRPTSLLRARVRADGTIEHLMLPEYHGDPRNSAGCLAFWHFGWDMLDQLASAGFVAPAANTYWQDKFGYLGGQQAFFTARKPLSSDP